MRQRFSGQEEITVARNRWNWYMKLVHEALRAVERTKVRFEAPSVPCGFDNGRETTRLMWNLNTAVGTAHWYLTYTGCAPVKWPGTAPCMFLHSRRLENLLRKAAADESNRVRLVTGSCCHSPHLGQDEGETAPGSELPIKRSCLTAWFHKEHLDTAVNKSIVVHKRHMCINLTYICYLGMLLEL